MTSSEWAAWVQAVGSLIAITVAIYVPNAVQNRQEKIKREADRLLARDRALALVRPLKDWIQRTSPWSDALARCEPLADVMVIGWLVERFESLEMPPSLRQLEGRLHELGPAAEAMQNLFYRHDMVVADRPAMVRYALGDEADENEARILREQHASTLRNLFDAMSAGDQAVTQILAKK